MRPGEVPGVVCRAGKPSLPATLPRAGAGDLPVCVPVPGQCAERGLLPGPDGPGEQGSGGGGQAQLVGLVALPAGASQRWPRCSCHVGHAAWGNLKGHAASRCVFNRGCGARFLHLLPSRNAALLVPSLGQVLERLDREQALVDLDEAAEQAEEGQVRPGPPASWGPATRWHTSSPAALVPAGLQQRECRLLACQASLTCLTGPQLPRQNEGSACGCAGPMCHACG